MFSKRIIITIAIISIFIFAGCVNRDEAQANNGDKPEMENEIMLSPELRQAPQWDRINYHASWILGTTGQEIARLDEVNYYLYLDGREYLKNDDCYFNFDGDIWKSACVSFYCEPSLILAGIYGLESEVKQYSVEQIKEYLGADISWGVDLGNDFFQYSFEDMTVRFYVDKEKEILRQNAYVLIGKPESGKGLFTGIDYITPETVLGRPEWEAINKHKNELGKTFEEIIAGTEGLQFYSEAYYMTNEEKDIYYYFDIKDRFCEAVFFQSKEFFPDAEADLSEKELRECLKTTLIWGSYDGGAYQFIFDGFILYLQSDENRNVPINGWVQMNLIL